jgi:hypothetical protein
MACVEDLPPAVVARAPRRGVINRVKPAAGCFGAAAAAARAATQQLRAAMVQEAPYRI